MLWYNYSIVLSDTIPNIFECMSKTEPTNKEEIDKGLKYMSVYQYPTQFIQVLPSYRCVVSILCTST